MEKVLVILDRGHGADTPGKRSPDGTLREWAYARDITLRLQAALDKEGYKTYILVPEDKDVALSIRCQRAKEICNKYKGYKTILLSIHCNAAPPNDKKWHDARGWCAFTSVGKTESDRICKCLYDAAEVYLSSYIVGFPTGTKQKPIRMTKDESRGWESDFYILKNTPCPAILTENLFQDNRNDVAFLLSEKGKNAIVNIHLAGLIKYIEGLDVVPSITVG